MNGLWTGAAVIIVSVGLLFHLCSVIKGGYMTNLDAEYS